MRKGNKVLFHEYFQSWLDRNMLEIDEHRNYRYIQPDELAYLEMIVLLIERRTLLQCYKDLNIFLKYDLPD